MKYLLTIKCCCIGGKANYCNSLEVWRWKDGDYNLDIRDTKTKKGSGGVYLDKKAVKKLIDFITKPNK
jgi:hypothetical protein